VAAQLVRDGAREILNAVRNPGSGIR